MGRMNAGLENLLERAQAWPEAARDELLRVADEIEHELLGDYDPTPAELAGIDRGLHAAAGGEIASDHEVEAALAKFRRA